jgi:hypothetical protein
MEEPRRKKVAYVGTSCIYGRDLICTFHGLDDDDVDEL